MNNFFQYLVTYRRLAQAIREAGWRQFRTMSEAKPIRYSCETRVISRWEPTSQYCSDYGYRCGKLVLSVRELICLGCNKQQDRDCNAAMNVDAGRSHTDVESL